MTPLLPSRLGEPSHDSPLSFVVPDDLRVPVDIQSTDDVVEDIHKEGGTLQGTPHGPVDRGRHAGFIAAAATAASRADLRNRPGGMRLDLEGELWRGVLASRVNRPVLADGDGPRQDRSRARSTRPGAVDGLTVELDRTAAAASAGLFRIHSPRVALWRHGQLR